MGRDLSKTIIIDNIPENYNKQPNNGLISISWKDDIFDKQLVDLKEILAYIVENRVENVTQFIKRINDELRRFSNLDEENRYPQVDYTKFV